MFCLIEFAKTYNRYLKIEIRYSFFFKEEKSRSNKTLTQRRKIYVLLKLMDLMSVYEHIKYNIKNLPV